MTEILRSVGDMAIYPVVALCIFMAAFGLVIWWTLRLDKKLVNEMADIPLDRHADSEGVTNHE